MSPLTPEAFRARFPLLSRRVYANSCSQGALSTDVEAALTCFTRSWHDEGSPREPWVGEVERLRSAVAVLVGADPDEIAIMPSASAAVGTSLRFDTGRPSCCRAIGIPTIERQIAGLVDRFATGGRQFGLDVMTPQDPARRGPLVVIRVADPPALVRRIAAGIIASARGNGLRVSFHAYSNDEDVDAVLAALS